MRILSLKGREGKEELELAAVVNVGEYEQLLGDLHDLRVFSRLVLRESVSVTKTGARHAFAKWLLLPKTLRRRFPTRLYDFNGATCGAFLAGDTLYVVYEVPRQGLAEPGNWEIGRPGTGL